MTNNSTGREAIRMRRIQKFLKEVFDLRYNEVTGKIELKMKKKVDFDELSDYKLNSISVKLAEKNIKCSPNQLRDILISYLTPVYNPFKKYFAQLPDWDEVDYIEQLADTIETTDKDQWQYCFKKWIVAMVGSLLEDKVINHTVIILAGRQGIGKSSWLYNIIPGQLKEYYFSGTIKISNKDTLIMLVEAMLINLEEIGYLNNSELNQLKEVVTKPHIQLRRPYGRVNEFLPRRASFSGSVNDKEFLSDTTGSRRFLCFTAVKIDYQHKVNIDMVYSQALALFRNDFKYWFDSDEIDIIQKSNEQYRIKSIEEESLLLHFEPGTKGQKSKLLSTTEILSILNHSHKVPINDSSKLKLGKALKANKFLTIKRKGRQLYLLKEVDEEKASYLSKTMMNTDIHE